MSRSLKASILQAKKTRVIIPVFFTILGCSFNQLYIAAPMAPADSVFISKDLDYGTILQLIGTPAKVSALSNGFALLYEYVMASEINVAPKINDEKFKYWKIDATRLSAQRQTLMLIFDEQGILRNYRFQHCKERLGLGVGINLLVNSKNLLDTSYLEAAATVDQWGTSLLVPIDRLLNQHYSFGNGTNGLEQFGMPTSVGQHALEFEPK